jgi:hypothetical protein
MFEKIIFLSIICVVTTMLWNYFHGISDYNKQISRFFTISFIIVILYFLIMKNKKMTFQKLMNNTTYISIALLILLLIYLFIDYTRTIEFKSYYGLIVLLTIAILLYIIYFFVSNFYSISIDSNNNI